MPAMNPRLLLLEDDPVSAAFLRQALVALPARVEHATRLASARALAHPDQALWLFDVRLPDGDGGELLRELRQRGLQVPAMALTADHDASSHQRLRADGFARVMAKPLTGAELLAAVRQCLRAPAEPWDETMAMAALGGNREAVRSLRALFLAELPDQADDIAAALAQGDAARAQAQLHRLKASCGFVGAGSLLEAVQALSRAPEDAAAQARFQSRARALSA